MKFTEYFERTPESKRISHALMLTGDDPVLQGVVTEDFGRVVGLWDLRERFDVDDVRSVINLWTEGSLMGPRFLDIRVKSKPKNGKLWATFLSKLSASENYMTLRFDGDGPEWGGTLARSVFPVVECKFPKGIKSRIKLVSLRLRTQGCHAIDDDMVRELADRVKSTMELESAVKTLSLLSRTKSKITESDITYVAGEHEETRSIATAILRGNKIILTEQVEGEDPILVLSSWHAILKKLYCWMNQLGTQDDYREVIASDEAGDDEDEEERGDLAELKISKYQEKDYLLAKQRYSQPLIRSVMEEINEVYQDVRVGRKDGWEERARIIISKMA